MSNPRISVRGVVDINRALAGFDVKIKKRAMRKGYRGAANVVLAEARKRATRRTGRLAKALATSVRVKADGSGSAKVGPKRRSGARHAHLLEFGVRPHVIRARRATGLAVSRNRRPRQVRHPGHAARPFLGPALEASRGDAVDAFRDAVNEEIRHWLG